MSYSTGYFGVPGSISRRRSKVHIVKDEGLGRYYRKAVCGSKFSKDAEYQWCSSLIRNYVECNHCKSWYNKFLEYQKFNVPY